MSQDWDFINNPAVKYYHKTNSQWGNQTKYSYMVNVERWYVNSDVKNKREESSHYFIKQKKHGFSTALYVISEHYDFRKKYWIDNYKKPLKIIFNQSDRGEFLTTAFMDGLSVISAEKDLRLFWPTGEADHNKRKVDGEGHTGVQSQKLKYSKKKEHVVSAKEFCHSYFNSDSIGKHKDRKLIKEIFLQLLTTLNKKNQVMLRNVLMVFETIINLLFWVFHMKYGIDKWHV